MHDGAAVAIAAHRVKLGQLGLNGLWRMGEKETEGSSEEMRYRLGFGLVARPS